MFRSKKPKPDLEPAPAPLVRYDTEPSIDLPAPNALAAHFVTLQSESPTLARMIEGLARDRTFVHPETGDVIPLFQDGCTPEELSLIGWMAGQCQSRLSFEVGFGVGTSCAAILAGRQHAGRAFQHLTLDPGCIGGRGLPIVDLLEAEHAGSFSRVDQHSEIGLGLMIHEHGRRSTDFIFIDGGHRADEVFCDFKLADILCALGGFIVFDDAPFPAIETVISFVRNNRPDYAIADMPVGGLTVLRKIDEDTRPWEDFKPFPTPGRTDWTARP